MNERPAYKPIKVEDTSSFDRERGAHRVKRVHYELRDGTKSYVEIPHDQYGVETVQQHLEDAAARHEQVMSLRPGYTPMPPAPAPDPWGSSS